MALIRNGELVEDRWTWVDDRAALAGVSHQIVPLDLWQEQAETLRARGDPLGIQLASDQSPALIADDVAHFELVALEFPKFTDGRAYSYARLLRERYAFRGELRAIGNVLRDQFLFMARCGIDSFEVSDEQPIETWRAAIDEIAVFYQPTADGRIPALDYRQSGE